MIEQDVTNNHRGETLSGTLCLPDSGRRFPLIIMVHGSGPLDRDENMPGQHLNVFNSIAHSLAENGIASLRYDKRGCGRSTGDYYRTGHFDLVDDVIGWFDSQTQRDIFENDKIFILGHSEGSVIAPQVIAKRPSVAGLILLCPFVDRIESILIKQARQLQQEFENLPGIGGRMRWILSRIMGITVRSQLNLIDRLKSSTAETMKTRLQRVPAKSLRELIQLDPPTIFSQVTCPMLLIGGEKDLQCDPADVGRIARLSKAAVDAHVVPNLTHLLRFEEGQPSLADNREQLRRPVEAIVLELISNWLNKQLQVS